MVPIIISAPESFVYLLERTEGNKVIESFYSITAMFFSDALVQMGGFLQFVSHKEKLI
jgi:hypothetical protein